MKRQEIARQLAQSGHMSRAEACDELDQVVHKILLSLRHGQAAEVPGVGRLSAGAEQGDSSRAKSHAPKKQKNG
jgi:nucleoid DNA-binding protein